MTVLTSELILSPDLVTLASGGALVPRAGHQYTLTPFTGTVRDTWWTSRALLSTWFSMDLRNTWQFFVYHPGYLSLREALMKCTSWKMISRSLFGSTDMTVDDRCNGKGMTQRDVLADHRISRAPSPPGLRM